MINSLSVFTRLLTYLTRMYVIPLLVCIKQTSIYLVYTPVARTFSDSGQFFGRSWLRWTGPAASGPESRTPGVDFCVGFLLAMNWIDSFMLLNRINRIVFFFAELSICKSYPWPWKPSPEPWRSSVRPCSCGLDSTSVCISA